MNCFDLVTQPDGLGYLIAPLWSFGGLSMLTLGNKLWLLQLAHLYFAVLWHCADPATHAQNNGDRFVLADSVALS